MMLHRIVLVLTLLVAVGCTGDDTVKIFCPTLERVLMEDETCPDPDPPPVVTTPITPTTPTTPTTPNLDTDRGEDCIKVQDVDLEGTDQDDVICGNDEDNTIDGLDGDDTIYGRAGNDTLIGSNDRDTLKGEAGNDILRGGQDNDILDGGGGTDTADYSMESSPLNTDVAERKFVKVDLVKGQATDAYIDEDTLISIENVIGTSGADTITGDSLSNKLDGGDGADTINGGAGNDVIIGGAGEDTLDGGAGEDTLSYENEVAVEGGATAGTVTINLAANTAEVTVNNAAVDTIVEDSFENITGGDAGDALTGDERANKLTGGGGNDTLTGGLGRDTLTGGVGGDCFIVDATGATAGDAETIMDFNKKEDAIAVCGGESSVGDDEGEKLLKISGSRIEKLIVKSVEEIQGTTERVNPKYLHVATLSGSSTRLTADEIGALEQSDTVIPKDSSLSSCTCP